MSHYRKACFNVFSRCSLLAVAVAMVLPAGAASAQEQEAAAATAVEDPAADALSVLTPVDTAYLRIEWPAALVAALEHDKGDVPARQLAAKSCATLGEGLLVGKGPWGRGLFTDFGCYLAGSEDAKPLAGHPAKVPPMWVLRPVLEGESLALPVFYRPLSTAASERRVADVKMPASAWTQDMMREKGYAALVGALILDALPALRRFEPLEEDSSTTIDIPLSEEKVEPAKTKSLTPKKLALFTWFYNAKTKLWMPHIVGSVKIAREKSKRQWHLVIKERTGDKPLYAGPAAGPGTYRARILKLLSKRQKTLLTNESAAGFDEIRDGVEKAGRFLLLNTVDSGYVGVRIGRELIDASSAVIPPATVIGVIGEIRTGFLSGLRVYFDYVPRHSSSHNGEALWVEWSRLVAGYNFGIALPWIADRLEIAPKIGVWNVDSRLPYFADDGSVGYRDFTLNNALSLGLEGGVVWEKKSYLLRLWYARDVSVPGSRIAGVQSSVQSVRAGVDAMLKGPPVSVFGKNWRLSYLLFAYHEDLTFDQKSQQSKPFSLEFSSSYAGGGLSLAW